MIGALIVSQPLLANADDYLQHLRTVMDRYHHELGVYEDIGSPGNHFPVQAKWPNADAGVSCTGFATDHVFSGATALKCTFAPRFKNDFGGIVFRNGVLRGDDQEPRINDGTEPNAGVDLRGATALRFRARGLNEGEKIDLFIGGVGWTGNTPAAPYPDSSPAKHLEVTLTSQWTEYRIDLTGRDMSYVLGGLGWGANEPDNPQGATFYLDDIAYELSPEAREQRLANPRFLRSFESLPIQPAPTEPDGIDSVMRNLAFTYDNALAIFAFLADRSAENLKRARLIGDALVYASNHDRSYSDGRLRSAYAAGDLALPPGWTPKGRSGSAATPGYYDEGLGGQPDVWLDLENDNIDVGNNTWAMLALLALYEHTKDATYLDAATRIGIFITGNFRATKGTYQGFTGGWNYPENTTPTRRIWASTEHNLDLAAGLRRLALATGNGAWLGHGKHAETFVHAMRDTESGCHYAGTVDSETRNETYDQLPVDAQSWGVLALPLATSSHTGLLDCAIAHHQNEDNGFVGFDFNNDRDGVWFEGTAQMALAFFSNGRQASRNAVIETLRRAQSTAPYGNGQGIAAASRDGLTTGFHTVPGGDKLEYFRRLHIGATAWAFLAEVGHNPFFEDGSPVRGNLQMLPSRGGWRSVLK